MAAKSTQLNPGSYETDDVETLRTQIEQTRSNMSQTVDAIQAKLSPERLTAEAKQKVREATLGKVKEMANEATSKANIWGTQMMETIKQNPLPAALVGLGLGWLLMESNRSTPAHYYPPASYRPQEPYGYPQRYYETPVNRGGHNQEEERYAANQGYMAAASQYASDVTQNVQDRVGEMAGNIGATAGDMMNNLQTRAGEVTSTLQDQTQYLTQQAQQQAERAKRGFQETWQENPLTIAAVALAAGAAIGLILPITQQENEMMGATRDRLMQQAQDTAKETVQKVEQVAEKAYQAATDTAKAEMEQQPHAQTTLAI